MAQLTHTGSHLVVVVEVTMTTMMIMIPKQYTGKAQNQGTTNNSHTGHGTHTSKSTTVKVQYSRFNILNSVIHTMQSNYRIAATLYSLGSWFVSGI